ncbi:MAG: YceI family protein, partial [Alphaproteobacteria bacterium]
MFRLTGLVLALALALPMSAMAAVWHIRPAESSIIITATQQGANFTAQFKKFQTEIKFDPADLAHSSVVATIDTGSFDS